tara:strand:+ start:2451 stop:3515 length:1065 start_codon:yes stop_codon:yes gene_type:complete
MSLPPITVPTGAIRYNTDSNKMECFNGTKWMQIAVSSPDLGGNGGPAGDPTGNSADYVSGARGFVMGGSYSSPGPGTHNEIRYITIPTAGNTTDFGNLTHTTRDGGSCASRTRGLYRFGTGPGDINDNVDYITMSSTGDAGDFGDMGYNARGTEGLSNATRGIFVGGDNDGSPRTYYNTIEYVTIASTGAGKDFGERVAGTGSRPAGGASPTRGIMVGTNTSPYKQIDFITIASAGVNASDFGDALRVTTSSSSACSATRMVYGGASGPGEIDYLTIATTGNAVAFGDMTVDRSSFASASDCIRGVFMGGDGSPAQFNEIDYITIATQGDAVDFGDLPYQNQQCTGCSNGHGGL